MTRRGYPRFALDDLPESGREGPAIGPLSILSERRRALPLSARARRTILQCVAAVGALTSAV